MTLAGRGRELVDVALEASVVGSFSRVGFAARRALFHWDAAPAVDLSGRVALVTGATGGIGLATARALAAQGAEVWIVGRDAGRTEAARQQIVSATPGARVSTIVADLCVLNDVRRCAETVERGSARLDVLVHNAGALAPRLQYTGDGIEVTAQVHVIAPFLLTSRLLARLQATAGARVITVSSGGMYTQPLDLSELAQPRVPFKGARVYANAKRAQVVLNDLWARRPASDGVTFHAMHPGWADTPGVQESLPRFRALMRPLLRTPEQGADTVAWLAGSAAAGATNGAFWLDRGRRLTNRVPWTRTPEAAARNLWDWCAARAGIDVELGVLR